MTTERIPGGWITWGKSFAATWPSDKPTSYDRTDAWWRMKMALWSQSFPPRSAMTLIGVDLGQEIRD